MIRHEEALRVHGLCRILRKMDILQDVLVLTHRRSLDMYSQLDREDDFDETAEAPEVQCECVLRGREGPTLGVLTLRSSVAALTQQNPEITPPDFSTVQVSDIFQKLVRTWPRLLLLRVACRGVSPVAACCCRGPCRCSVLVLAGAPFTWSACGGGRGAWA